MFGTTCALLIAAVVQAGAPGSSPVSPRGEPAAVLWTDDRPVTHLFQNLFRDLRSIPSANTAVVISAGGAGAVATKGADKRFASWSARSGDPSYTKVGDVFGDGWMQAGGAVATYAIGRLARSPQITHVGSDLIRAQALNAVVNTTIKVTVDRTRPSGGHWAFPSGHTSSTFASAAVLHAHYGWKVGGPAFATAGFVAWSRVRDRAHWLSDVAFGSAVGIVSGRAVAGKHGPRRIGVVPTVSKGGAAVTVFILSTQNHRGSSQAPR